ncbi:MAG: ABC transporter substrate-binding protein [Oscillospiraceae bacterium]|jgi:NitT/TauT family transport system substrate-binding protein|nr:ABC transporter substrate-binding protein [Oscillospiraceae bacterium]
MKKYLLAVFFIIFCLTIFGLYGINKNNSKGSLRLCEVARSVFYCPQYLALELGYFKDEGIEVELTTGNGSEKAMTSLLSGQSDVALLGSEMAMYVAQSGRSELAVLFAQLTKKDGSFLFGKEQNFSWKNLNGKKIISGRQGGMPEMVFSHTLKNYEINAEVINNIQFDLISGAFINGIGEYAVLFEPTASEMELNSKGHILASIGAVNPEIVYTVYASTEKFIKSNPKLIKNFVKAIYKAQTWLKNNTPEESAQKMLPYFPKSNLKILANAIRKYKEIGVWCENPVINKDSFNFTQELVVESGKIDKKVDPEKIIDNSYAWACLAEGIESSER